MGKFDNLNDYVAVRQKDFESCINVVEHELHIDCVSTNLRFHHIKFNGNGIPMVKALACKLYEYIIDYCLSARERSDTLTPQQSMILSKQARDLFRHPKITDDSPDKTGEAGETLLFFLMEAVLGAPQLVAKMELKTNSNDEVKGSDGIHVRWNEKDKLVDLYFGEAKLYKKVSSALDEALKSISSFHESEMYKHEFNIVTKFFKYANDEIKNAISELIISGEPGPNIRLNHACLIGYNWHKFNKLKVTNEQSLEQHFLKEFKNDFPRLKKLLEDKFNSFPQKHLKFDVFFIPFPSVTDFRNEFNAALN